MTTEAERYTDVVINGKKISFYDWKSALVDVLDYELNRLIGTEGNIGVINQWPAAKTRLPLVTILQLTDDATERFIGEDYQGRETVPGEEAGDEGDPDTASADVEAWMMREVYEIRVWATSRDLAHAMFLLAKAAVMAYLPDMQAAGEIQDVSIGGGRDEIAEDKQDGQRICWRVFNLSGTLPFRLSTDLEVIDEVEVEGDYEKAE